jgi:hypothetical protein
LSSDCHLFDHLNMGYLGIRPIMSYSIVTSVVKRLFCILFPLAISLLSFVSTTVDITSVFGLLSLTRKVNLWDHHTVAPVSPF